MSARTWQTATVDDPDDWQDITEERAVELARKYVEDGKALLRDIGSQERWIGWRGFRRREARDNK